MGVFGDFLPVGDFADDLGGHGDRVWVVDGAIERFQVFFGDVMASNYSKGDGDGSLVTERDRAVTEGMTEQTLYPVTIVTEVTEQTLKCSGENNDELVLDASSGNMQGKAKRDLTMTPVTPSTQSIVGNSSSRDRAKSNVTSPSPLALTDRDRTRR